MRQTTLFILMCFCLIYTFSNIAFGASTEIKALAIDGGWILRGPENRENECDVSYNDNKKGASVFFNLLHAKNEIDTVLVFEGFSKDNSLGWVDYHFDAGLPISVQIEPAGATIMFDFKKHVADVFMAKLRASKALTVEFPSWPEEYPVTIPLPSNEFKTAWENCIKNI